MRTTPAHLSNPARPQDDDFLHTGQDKSWCSFRIAKPEKTMAFSRIPLPRIGMPPSCTGPPNHPAMPLIMTCQDNQQSNAARRILLHELLMASTLWPIFPLDGKYTMANFPPALMTSATMQIPTVMSLEPTTMATGPSSNLCWAYR